MKNSKAFVLITLAVILIGAIMVFFPGVSRSADYMAGTTAEISGSVSEANLRSALSAQGVRVGEIMVAGDGTLIVNTLDEGDSAKITAAVEQLKAQHAEAEVKAVGNRTAGKSLMDLLWVALPIVAVIAAGFIYMCFLVKAKKALVLALCALMATAFAVALSIIVRINMTYDIMSAFVLTAFVAVIEAIVLAYYIRNIANIKDGENVVKKAAEQACKAMAAVAAVMAIIGLAIVIFTPAALKMYGAVMLIGAIAAFAGQKFLAPSLTKAEK